jgi:SAM-dependent methyltransferase
VSRPDRELLSELEARVAARREAGDYRLDWLGLEVVPEEPPTPLDLFLRTPRPEVRLELATAGTRGGAMGAARERITGWLHPVLEDWDARQADADARLREGLAWLLMALQDERAQREDTEEAIAEGREELAEEMRRLALSRLAAGDLRLAALEERLAEVAQRTSDLERARRSERIAASAAPAPAGPSGQPSAASVEWDYATFEDRFRGSEAVIRERGRSHVRRLAGRRRVVDLGCGRGEILELLADHDIGAEGVDSDAEMVAHVQAKGLRATHGDLFAYLGGLAPGAIDGALASHVIEHLAFPDQVRLIRLAARALTPGGVLIVETPNPTSLLAGSVNFRRDPTHVAPVHPDTLAFLLSREGFEHVEVEYLASVPPGDRLEPLPPTVGPLGDMVTRINAALERLDRLVYGHQDFAASGVRAG